MEAGDSAGADEVGDLGVGAVAVLDSSSIPVPMDAILALYVWNDKRHFWLYCLMAAAGSAIGGLLPYGLGRAGGELFLLKRVDRAKFEQLRDRFQRQEFLAVMIPSMMPPPAPWKIFIFASGVFEMRVANFLLAVLAGRMVRWLALSLLVLKLGPGAVDLVARHALATVWLWARWRCWDLRGGGCGRSAAASCWRTDATTRFSPALFGWPGK